MKYPLRFFTFAILAIALAGAALSENKAPLNLLILGDSLTEGLGVEKDSAYPALLEHKLKSLNPLFHVTNGGVSGSTSASALRRLQWYVKTNPNCVLFTLGSNDGLRGLPIADTKRNLESAILFAQKQHWKVFLAGLKVPPNYGPAYAKDFEKIFSDLAKQYKIPLMPFLLEGIAGEIKLNQQDGIHPNEAGHKIIAENLYVFIKKQMNFQ
jgi:acyl-CoA thioesterase I